MSLYSLPQLIEHHIAAFEQCERIDGGLDPRELRSRSRTRRASSKLAIASDTAGWDIARCVAALAMPPHCTTADRICRSRSLRRRPIRLSHCCSALAIGIPYNVIADFTVPLIRPGDYGHNKPRERAMTVIRLLMLCLATAIVLLLATSGIAAAQNYPNRPLRIIVPFPPSGGPDTVARILGNKLTEQLGQQVIVDPRPGGSGFIAVEIAKNAPPDGYTLLLATFNTLCRAPGAQAQASLQPRQGLRRAVARRVGGQCGGGASVARGRHCS